MAYQPSISVIGRGAGVFAGYAFFSGSLFAVASNFHVLFSIATKLDSQLTVWRSLDA